MCFYDSTYIVGFEFSGPSAEWVDMKKRGRNQNPAQRYAKHEKGDDEED